MSQLKFLKFYADWCSPCKFYERTINTVKDKYPEVEFVELNVDFDFETCEKYQVTSMPTTVTLNGDTVIDKEVGPLSQAKLIEILDRLKNS